MTERTWAPDMIEGFEHCTLPQPMASDGPVDITVVRRLGAGTSGAAVLYVHGFSDYWFQTHLAEFYEAHGLRFYAVDLRRHGRSLRDHQLPNYTPDIDEYIADLDAAIDLLRREEGVDWLLVNGHSTGGLVAVLQAHRGARRVGVDAVYLNSPFLDMNLPPLQEKLLEPALSAVGNVAPTFVLPGLSSFYGDSIHSSRKGSWDFDLAYKPLAGFPARAGWFRAIHRAQAEVARGLTITAPVLLLHAGHSSHPKVWDEDVRHSDVVLDVADMIRLGPGLGTDVEVVGVPDGIHDLALSEPVPRAASFALVAAWLVRVRA